MCILICKEKNVELPSKKRLEICFENNSDGCGFMFTRNNKLIIEKGFMDFDNFYKRLMEVDKELNLYEQNVILHFRISTSGKICGNLTHGYVVTDDYNKMKETYVELEEGIAMSHNGILPSKYIPSKEIQNKHNINDTMKFIHDVVYPLYKLDKYSVFKPFYQELLAKEIGTNKIAFLNANGEMTKIGNFILGDDGVYYSNDTYQEMWWSSYSTSSTVSGSYYYGNYYDNYEDIPSSEWWGNEITLEEFGSVLEHIKLLQVNDVVIYENDFKEVEELIISVEDKDIFGILDDELMWIDYTEMTYYSLGKVLDYLKTSTMS